MRFAELLKHSESTLTRIFNHPANTGLLNGSLPYKNFLSFVKADVTIYLPRYAEANTIIARRFETSFQDEYAKQFHGLADISAYEEFIQSNYLKPNESKSTSSFNKPHNLFEINPELNTTLEPQAIHSEVLEKYAFHLTTVATNSHLHEAVASITVCLWLYVELGKKMDLSTCNTHPHYLLWLQTYQDPAFIALAEQLVLSFEEITQDVKDNDHAEKVKQAFEQSLAFELSVFDSLVASNSLSNESTIPINKFG